MTATTGHSFNTEPYGRNEKKNFSQIIEIVGFKTVHSDGHVDMGKNLMPRFLVVGE
jgi:hypothetical protein